MNDSTLTAGLLTRLDAITSKMGVAASEVWGIWLATSWRPMLGFVVGIGVALVIALISGLTLRRAIKYDGHNDELAGFLGVAGCLGLIVALIITMVNLGHLPDVLTYLSEPRLYALDQLRGLVDK